MGSRIVVVRWCDNHDGSQDFPAEERAYLGADGKPRLADTCDPCDENMTNGQIRRYVAEFGRPVPVEPKGKSAGRVKPNSPEHNAMHATLTGTRKGRKPAAGAERAHYCLWCPLDYAASSGWAKHVKDLHGFNSSLDALGTVCPACGQEDVEIMGGHAVRTHPEIATTATGLFLWARDNGDPHGIYAQRRALGRNVQEIAA